RDVAGGEITTGMDRGLSSLGVSGQAIQPAALPNLYSAYMKSLGDQRSGDALAVECSRKVQEIQERGFDLGDASGLFDEESGRAAGRIQPIYSNPPAPR